MQSLIDESEREIESIFMRAFIMDQQRNDDRLHVNETAIFYYIIIMVILNVSPLLFSDNE